MLFLRPTVSKMDHLKKLGSAPAPGAAADALVRRRERARASSHRFFLNQRPKGVPAFQDERYWTANARPPAGTWVFLLLTFIFQLNLLIFNNLQATCALFAVFGGPAAQPIMATPLVRFPGRTREPLGPCPPARQSFPARHPVRRSFSEGGSFNDGGSEGGSQAQEDPPA